MKPDKSLNVRFENGKYSDPLLRNPNIKSDFFSYLPFKKISFLVLHNLKEKK